jgi:hypothetical protein
MGRQGDCRLLLERRYLERHDVGRRRLGRCGRRHTEDTESHRVDAIVDRDDIRLADRYTAGVDRSCLERGHWTSRTWAGRTWAGDGWAGSYWDAARWG